MNTPLTRFICRILALSMMLLPFHSYAGLVGTDGAAAQSQRVLVRDFVGRSDVAAKLQALGVPPAQAQERVDALTDAEIAPLATRIDKLPAGADPTTIGILLVVALVVWRLWVASEEKEAAASKRTTTAPAKPAAKPEAK
jgi:hypothetical protein